MLFNLYVEWINSEALQNLEVGIKVNGRIVNNIRNADDTVLIAGNPQNLKATLHALNAKKREAGLKINSEKTKMMVICRAEPKPFTLQADGRIIERVSQCEYLGIIIKRKMGSGDHIKDRAIQADLVKIQTPTLRPTPSFPYGGKTWIRKVRSTKPFGST